ncbi:MAG: hypothetical protein OXH86_18495, partial [Acidimicrobiaceae bacterium]|nr:hypothetical protein [Acidimicrobiaceae bacterium]
MVPAGGAGAQSALPAQRTFVSNAGQSTGSDVGWGHDIVQAFTTGSNSAGYSLRSVEVAFFPAVARIGSSDLAVSVHADSSGQPGASLGTLAGPPVEPSNGVSTVTFTSDGIDLDPGTTYFLMIDMAANFTTSGLTFTDSDGEDAGGLPGWSIADNALSRPWNSTSTFTDGPTVQSRTLRVGLGGTVKCPSMWTFSNAGVSVSYSGDGVPV